MDDEERERERMKNLKVKGSMAAESGIFGRIMQNVKWML
jgi:hypothetical protein